MADRLGYRSRASTKRYPTAERLGRSRRVPLVLNAGIDVEALHAKIGRAADRALPKRGLADTRQPRRAPSQLSGLSIPPPN
jgi:hypothetical protein